MIPHVQDDIISNLFALEIKPMKGVCEELEVRNKLLLTNGCYNPLNEMISNSLDALTAFLDLHSSTYKKPVMPGCFNPKIK